MRARLFASLVVAVAILLPLSAAAQRPRPPTVLPRTPDGRPDLQGIWINNTSTPLERPKRFADKAFLTEQEAADYERDWEGRFRDFFGDLEAQTTGESADVYNESGKVVPDRRTSLIVDPSDGKIPPLTPSAKSVADVRTEARRQHLADGPEDLNPWERCLLSSVFRTPLGPSFMNPNLQIVQTADYVVIRGELIHDGRVIALNRAAHLPPALRRWMGDSIGRWEGDTLIVDTTNFTDKAPFRGSDDALHVIERFTRESADLIRYEFTVDDPSAFTKPWSAVMPLRKSDERIYEYACHEANYAMVDILRGARFAEREQKDR